MSVLSSLASVLCRGRRVPRHGFAQITSKQGPKNFYKGKGCKPTGKHTSKGGYVLLDEKRPTYVVPDLSNFKARRKLKPYVAVEVRTSNAAPAAK